MSFGFGLGFPKSAIAAGIQPALNLQFAGSQVLDPRITFTRASSATYFDSAGVLQRATYNLLLRSEEFNNAAWTKTNSSVTPDAAIAPNGLLAADKLVENTATGFHYVIPAVGLTVVSGASITTSVYAKSAERTGVGIFPYSSAAGARFNLASGTVIAADAGITATITSVGNGWYRCSATITAPGTSATPWILTLNAGNATNYTGDGTSGIFIWGAQLEQASTAGPYWATTSAANGAPRFDYNPSTLAPLGLLIEEQRTNSIRNNTMVGAVAGTPGTLPTNWSGTTSLTGLTQQIVGTGTDSGITYIDIRLSGTPSAAGVYRYYFESATAVAALTGQTWSNSYYIKLAAGSLTGVSSFTDIYQEFTSSGVYVTEAGVTAITPTSAALSTQRSSTTRTLTGGATVAFLRSGIQLSLSGVAIDITLRIGLPQLEQGAFATSVIPTTTAAATRAVDNASMTGTNFSSWYNATEGTFYLEANMLQTQYGFFRTILAAANSDGSSLIGFQVPSNSEALRFSVSSACAIQSTQTFGAVFKVAGAYKVDDFASAKNGALVGTDTAGAIPNTIISLNFGNTTATGVNTSSSTYIRRIAYFNTRLANANLQALTL